MKKRILVAALIAAAVSCGVYFGVGYAQSGVLTVGQAYRIWESNMAQRELVGFAVLESEQEFVGNPGGVNMATITIFNTRDQDRTFWISIEPANPNKLLDGYECLPARYFTWFTPTGWNGERVTAVPIVLVGAGQYRQVYIRVAVPLGTDYLNQKAEVRLRVTETGAGGLVVNALESRWYIVVVETP